MPAVLLLFRSPWNRLPDCDPIEFGSFQYCGGSTLLTGTEFVVVAAKAMERFCFELEETAICEMELFCMPSPVNIPSKKFSSCTSSNEL